MELTQGLSIYAAFLSTVVFIWNVVKSRRRFRVKLVFGINDEEGKTQAGAWILIMNPSSHSVRITAVTILYKYREITLAERLKHAYQYKRFGRFTGWVHYPIGLNLPNFATGLPMTIESGNSHRIFIPECILSQMLEEDAKVFAAVVQDALWAEEYSKPLRKWKAKQSS